MITAAICTTYRIPYKFKGIRIHKRNALQCIQVTLNGLILIAILPCGIIE